MRQFFALANQHMRWQLNDLARRLDEQPAAVELHEGFVPAPASSDSGITPDGRRMLEAIDNLPEDEREVFGLVRLQGLTHAEAAEVLDVSTKTVQRRLNRASLLLAEELADCARPEEPRSRTQARVAERPSPSWSRAIRASQAGDTRWTVIRVFDNCSKNSWTRSVRRKRCAAMPRVAAAGPRALAAKTRLRRPTGCDVPGAESELADRRPSSKPFSAESAPDPGL